MKVSEHFSLSEIKCHCGCGQDKVDKKLYPILEEFRDFCGSRPMMTHCVNRCKFHNKNIGGVNNSKHVGGHAWDGHVQGLSIDDLHMFAKMAYDTGIITGGLGFYDWGIHIDTGRKRRW